MLGRLLSQTDPAGGKTTHTYDPAGRRTSTTDPLGNKRSFEYDAHGNITAETDPNGNRTTFEYDAENRLTRQIAPDGTVTLHLLYDPLGRLAAERDALGNTTEYTYDPLGRVIETTDPRSFRITSTYDEEGNRISDTDAEGNTTHYIYDNLGQLVRTILPNGESNLSVYDSSGNRILEQDYLGEETTFTYDQNNRLTETKNAIGETVKITYDKVGNRTSVSTPKGIDTFNITTFTYDGENRLTERTDPLGAVEKRSYDPAGRLIELISRNNLRTTYTYDQAGRRTTEVWWNGDTEQERFTFTYDKRGNRLTAKNSKSAYTHTYDTQNRLLSTDNTGTQNIPELHLDYLYDAASNILKIADNLGVTVDSTYEDNRRLTRRTWKGDTLPGTAVTFTYDPRGALTTISRFKTQDATGPAVKTILTYDEQRREESLTHEHPDTTPLSTERYTYDPNSRLIETLTNNTPTTYTYDKIGQLLARKVADIEQEQFTYLLGGDRNHGTGEDITANRITSTPTHTLTYDAAGNITQKLEKATNHTTTYTFNHRNHLTTVTKKDEEGTTLLTATYTYDVDNRRIAKTVNTTTTYYTYDRSHIWAEFNQEGTLTARYLYGDTIDDILARWTPEEGLTWYLKDRQGTITHTVDQNGNQTSSTTYNAFGGP